MTEPKEKHVILEETLRPQGRGWEEVGLCFESDPIWGIVHIELDKSPPLAPGVGVGLAIDRCII